MEFIETKNVETHSKVFNLWQLQLPKKTAQRKWSFKSETNKQTIIIIVRECLYYKSNLCSPQPLILYVYQKIGIFGLNTTLKAAEITWYSQGLQLYLELHLK